jgi:hypothetical protein
MFSPQCPFCDHTNPADAKFCNECGSPLHLKPCKQCDAINDRSAKKCYNCGTDDPALVIAPDGPPLSTTAESTVAAATPSGVGFERARLSLPESLAPSYDVRSRRPDDATAIDPEPDVEVVAHEPRSLGRDVNSMHSATPESAQVVAPHNVAATAERRPTFRTAMTGLPPVVLLATIAASAYYVYRNPLQLREWLSAVQAPANQFRAAVVSQPQVATSDQATAAQLFTQGESVVGMPSTATPVAVDPRDNAMRAAGNQFAPNDPAADQSTAARAATATAAAQLPPGKSRAKTSPPVAGPRGCTDAMAALGSCSPKKTSTSTKTTAKKSKKTSTKKPASTPATPGPKALATTTETSKTAPGN